ncbi:hypothetical protein AOLI_G00060770 [Acnodon oligacanthus]
MQTLLAALLAHVHRFQCAVTTVITQSRGSRHREIAAQQTDTQRFHLLSMGREDKRTVRPNCREVSKGTCITWTKAWLS